MNNPETVASRGERLQRLLSDEDFVGSIHEVKMQLYNEWEKTGMFGRRRRELIHAEIRALKRILVRLNMIVSDGKKARYDIEKELGNV